MSEVRTFQVPSGGTMKIGIDLHGVIDSAPEFFKGWLSVLSLKKVGVYIISGPPRPEIVAELEELGFRKGIHYKEVYSIVNYLKESGVPMWQDKNGDWWSNDRDWRTSKARICNKLSIDWMLDDHEMYKAAFADIKTNFTLYEG